jgi:hypothetical protein
MEEKVICVICNKKIRAFKNRDDWKKRLMHLKCWKDDQETMKMNSIFEDFLKEEEKRARQEPSPKIEIRFKKEISYRL